MPNHRGRSRNLTPEELNRLLAIPLYYLIVGKAQAVFPNTSVTAQSSFVKIILTSTVDSGYRGYFPAYVGWKQWNDVVVPVINNGNYATWLGYLGGTLGETDNEDELPIQMPLLRLEANLFGAQPTTLIRQLGLELQAQAEDAGYGSPS